MAGLFVLLFYSVTQKIYSVPFSYGDDYRLLVMHHPADVPQEYIKASRGITFDVAGSIQYDFQQGRFRPLAWVWTNIQSAVFGLNHKAFRLFNLLVLFFSVLFFYKTLLLFQVKDLVAMLSSLVFIFGKNAETWWLLIPPAQNMGELCLIAAIFCLALCLDKIKPIYFYSGLVLLLLASFMKESFMFIAPFIVMLFAFLAKNHFNCYDRKRSILLFAVSLVPILFLAGIVMFSGKVYGYENSSSTAEVFVYNTKQLFISLCPTIAPLSYLIHTAFKNKSLNKTLSSLLLITAAIIISQLLLLVKIKMEDQHHYLMPVILIPLLVSGIALSRIQQLNKTVFYPLLIIYSLFLLNNMKNTFINTTYAAIKTSTFYSMLDYIKSNPAPNYIYVNNTCTNNDWLCGTSVVLQQNLQKPFHLYHLALGCDQNQISSYEQVNQNNLALIKPAWVLFELPDEKNKENYPLKVKGNNIEIAFNNSEYNIEGKLYTFENYYSDIQTRDLLTFKKEAAHKKTKLTYKAIYIN